MSALRRRGRWPLKQFEAASEIAEHLRDRRAVLLNLEKTDPAVARRLIDIYSSL